MSSLYVRTEIKNFFTTEAPTENLIDLTAEFDEMEDLVESAGITVDDPWVGIQFLSYEEIPVDILSTNDTGKYRETGTILIHIVDVAKKGGYSDILIRAEAIRDKFRGRRIGPILIEAVSPPNFGQGITLSFEGGYTAAVVNIEYKYDRVLI
jgi:hypothetical protein